ncbi:hypothetical protein CRM22_005246 [Opisthorchis felineus]|uniref:PB1 domain-containing protein n=1 Tax=Opisthorchis felineus TaxID=147828 RepID=A0A4S2LS08_OPIFE|nr:hypothetical protein CRM22_005246 [Opisthorchis felineus]
MPVVKVHLKLPEPKKPEVCRWTPNKPLNDLTIKDIHNRCEKMDDGTYDSYSIRWNDGTDMCLITNNDQLREAIRLQRVKVKDTEEEFSFYVEAHLPVKSAVGRPAARPR